MSGRSAAAQRPLAKATPTTSAPTRPGPAVTPTAARSAGESVSVPKCAPAWASGLFQHADDGLESLRLAISARRRRSARVEVDLRGDDARANDAVESVTAMAVSSQEDPMEENERAGLREGGVGLHVSAATIGQGRMKIARARGRSQPGRGRGHERQVGGA